MSTSPSFQKSIVRKQPISFDAFRSKLLLTFSQQSHLVSNEDLLATIKQRRSLVVLDGLEAIEFASLEDE